MRAKEKEDIKKIINKINEIFSSHVISLILFGSAKNRRKFNDIDLELVLDKPRVTDFIKLNRILSSFRTNIELHISYKSQLDRMKNYRRKAQGSYLLYSLNEGILLAGKENYFKQLLLKADKKIIKRDLCIKNLEYQHSLREFLIDNNLILKREKFVKYLARYIAQILVLENKLNYHSILSLSNQKIIKKLSELDILNKEQTKNLSVILDKKDEDNEKLIRSSSIVMNILDKVLENQLKKYYE